mgnify:CR=1 FL=1
MMEEFKRTGLAMLVDSRGQSKVASRTGTANGDVVAINMQLCSMVDDVIDGRDTVVQSCRHCSAIFATSFSSFDFCKKMAIDK